MLLRKHEVWVSGDGRPFVVLSMPEPNPHDSKLYVFVMIGAEFDVIHAYAKTFKDERKLG